MMRRCKQRETWLAMLEGQNRPNDSQINENVLKVSTRRNKTHVIQSHSRQTRFEKNFCHLHGIAGQTSKLEAYEITPALVPNAE